ncbi:hypothetical protein RHGRI_008650 [Rhododendron griersonianum]|uniref:CCHC-type domain-containing protein n=1 Tax=Rhododendron griersonianum TaxID=479676 RepID=A0AAV6L256_9ERIC|nr:hypothetical protein RHGRI_008650 [Rhododendron griersonianum]
MEVTRASMVAVVMLAFVFAVFLPSAFAHSAAPAPAPTSDGTAIDQGIAYALMMVEVVVAFEFVNGVGFIVEISFSDDDVLVHCSLLLDDGGFIGVKLSKSGHNTVHPSARLLYPTRIHTSIKSSLSRIPLLFCPSSSLAPSDLTSTVYVRAALTSNTNDADPISNALDPQPRFDDKKKGDTSRGPETETEYLSLGVMDTPNRSTNSNGVSYDWESNSESDSGPSTEDSHSNNFGAQTARYGILSSGYNLMSFYASHGQDSFEDAREAEYEMTSWMRKRWERENNKDNKTDIGEASNGQLLFGVGDPLVVKTKGNPGKNSSAQHYPNPRKCSNCKCRGHDKRTCPKLSSGHPIDDLPM